MSRRRKHVSIEFDSDVKALEPPKKKARHCNFSDVAILPSNVDNCAVVTRRLEKDTQIQFKDQIITIKNTILEGHRICIKDIPAKSALLSWGLPFGYALCNITVGEYICNQSMLDALSCRKLGFELPTTPNFEDRLTDYHLSTFAPGVCTLNKYSKPETFQGFQRNDGRGIGIRNYILILGLTYSEASYVRLLRDAILNKIDITQYSNIDGIVSVSHTEGDPESPINNYDLLLRSLCGFIVHPNIGAVLIVDSEQQQQSMNISQNCINKQSVIDFMKKNPDLYNTDKLIHKFYTLSGVIEEDVDCTTQVIKGWLGDVNNFKRSECPISELKIALQCGGSDSFSGISGNPLAGWAVEELLKNNGTALLSETDELMGAEEYILKNCRNEEVAQKFLKAIDHFKEWASWHGQSVESNPSGGNKLRGLYNIALKSIGAAMKKPSSITLEDVISYGERLTGRGYYMMDSPGNDLESISGQVASGCQLIYFITGNGSITNFPFVPTIKIITTTSRYKMLQADMDINAGEHLDGTPMAECGAKLWNRTKDIISGAKSVGEKAGHYQVSLWRNWAQTNDKNLEELIKKPEFRSGLSFKTNHRIEYPSMEFLAIKSSSGSYVTDQVGLVFPTSLCSSQVAVLIAEKLNEKLKENSSISVVSRFVALPHTEGCGVSSGSSESLYKRIVLGHLVSPLVKYSVLLEHGCEKTHNDYMAQEIKNTLGLERSYFGWASVQMDGGIDSVTNKVLDIFQNKLSIETPCNREPVSFKHLRLSLTTLSNVVVSNEVAVVLTKVIQCIVDSGGLVVVPQNSSLVKHQYFLDLISDKSDKELLPTLSYGQRASQGGLHLMETFTGNWVETVTGLGATGVELILCLTEGRYASRPTPSHPMVPLVQVGMLSVVLHQLHH
eukprot:TRINITY_DN1730_c0_g1_i3.p1 TRINITY_DN1730_c0_g1~~TRINITY_DN1730_c0_g1_i3.p1  ORF type:complete len:898 (+),score=166.49 TRINITY_DN1730_c0_g1_i3:53-2746(+)